MLVYSKKWRPLVKSKSVNGMVNLGMNVEREGWKKYICVRIQESGRRTWKDGFNDTEREKEYVRMKESPKMKALQMEVLVQEFV